MRYTIYKSIEKKKTMTTARKRYYRYNSALKIQNMSFIKMPFVLKRSILISVSYLFLKIWIKCVMVYCHCLISYREGLGMSL